MQEESGSSGGPSRRKDADIDSPVTRYAKHDISKRRHDDLAPKKSPTKTGLRLLEGKKTSKRPQYEADAGSSAKSSKSHRRGSSPVNEATGSASRSIPVHSLASCAIASRPAILVVHHAHAAKKS